MSEPVEVEGIQYYWCVNCGHAGDFGRKRLRVLNCEKCNYDALTPYEMEEILEQERLRFRFRNFINENIVVTGS